MPLLPDCESGQEPLRSYAGRRSRAAREERLERLLTPSELDMVEHHRV
ncbi:MAG: hypothetical protein J2P18_19820 [Nocardia sp.]|nr:hypothetical protein [Nocardia sp.]